MSILTIAHLTLYESRRRRIVAAALVCATAYLVVYSAGLFFVHREQLREGTALLQRQLLMSVLTLMGLYGANFLSVLFAVLLPVDTLSGEIDSGVMQTLASKPLRRADIVVGKWLGHAVLVTSYLLALSFGVILVVRVIAGPLPVRPVVALPLMLMEVVLLMTVSIAGGTRLNTVTNGVTALGFYGIAFIGGWVEQVGTMTGNSAAQNVGTVASLIMPTEALWQRAAYFMQPSVMRDLNWSPFSSGALPSVAMVWWAVLYAVFALVSGVQAFRKRAL